MTFDGSAGEGVLRVEGNLDIECAGELKRLLIEAVALGKPLRLDLAQVGELDVTAIQLLWAGKCFAEKAGVAFALAGDLPGRSRGALGDAGFENLFGPAAGAGQPSR
jgi:anti-anti-sigma regulatory factor